MPEKATAPIGDKQITIETGKLAKQADGAVTVLSNRWAEQRQSVNRPRTYGLQFRYSWQ